MRSRPTRHLCANQVRGSTRASSRRYGRPCWSASGGRAPHLERRPDGAQQARTKGRTVAGEGTDATSPGPVGTWWKPSSNAARSRKYNTSTDSSLCHFSLASEVRVLPMQIRSPPRSLANASYEPLKPAFVLMRIFGTRSGSFKMFSLRNVAYSCSFS